MIDRRVCSAHNLLLFNFIDRLAALALHKLLSLCRLVHVYSTLSRLRGRMPRQKDLTALILSRLRNVRLNVILVVVVCFEELLNAVPAELGLALTHSLRILPLLIVDMIRIKVVYMNVRDVRRLHSSRGQSVPIEVREPWVLLQFFDSLSVAYALSWTPLQALIDKIRCFFVPAVRDGILLDLNLTYEDLVTDIFSCPTLVWSLAHHALIRNNTYCEVVSSHTMVLTAHDLRCHVAWCPARLARVVG